MHLASIRFLNWMAFRGEHVLPLEPKVYAIVAQLEGQDDSAGWIDVRRSNWLGKSSILEGVRFALYGTHRFLTEDEWISNGEKHGAVELRLDDGTRILRLRDRGKRTVLHFFPPDGTKASMKDEAQEEIDRLIMPEADFSSVAYWEQKQLSKFVIAKPAERMKIVSAWMRLEPLERCVKRVQAMSSDLEDRSKNLGGRLDGLDEHEARIEAACEKAKIEEVESATVRKVELLEGLVATLESSLEKNAVLMAAKSKVADYGMVVEEGKKVSKQFSELHLPVLAQQWAASEKELAERGIEYARARGAEKTAATVARGEFDGKCPVARIECPAKAAINEDLSRSRAAYEEAAKASSERRAELSVAEAKEFSARAAVQEARRTETKLDFLRKQAAKLAQEVRIAKESGEPEDPSVLRTKLDKERGDLAEARADLARVRGWIRDLKEIGESRERLRKERSEVEKGLGPLRELAIIFGKRGAQRRVSEGAIARIERGANQVLQDIGTSLQIEVRWSREGKEPASSCDACGHPFPSSTKVKNCERCGAARGPKLENKLDIVLSRQSGAAEDLAGGAFQLAASRWFRDVRGIDWGTAMLDEPFGALDAFHRQSFATHLVAMLSGAYGFEQSFVVAHHAQVLDALPGRIVVSSDGTWASPRVVA